jgi:hypothetical protein
MPDISLQVILLGERETAVRVGRGGLFVGLFALTEVLVVGLVDDVVVLPRGAFVVS